MIRDFELTDSEEIRLRALTVFEEEAYSMGFQRIAGIDEAGRGPLAGPVVAAACILPRGLLIPHVDDSKKLSPSMRQRLFELLTTDPRIQYGVGVVSHTVIDKINIYQATVQAMWEAVKALPLEPDYLLVDGMGLSNPSLPSLKLIKGDQLSQSIAVASIIAKETRDRLMHAFDEQFPHYGFSQHKGYGTPQHLEALGRFGPCPIHRYSFEPVRLNSFS